MIDPYLQQLKIKEKGETFTFQMLKAQAMKGQVKLTAMKIKRVDVRKRLTSAAIIASSKEDNGAEKSMPPQAKRVPDRNYAVMKKPLRHLPPLKRKFARSGRERSCHRRRGCSKGLIEYAS